MTPKRSPTNTDLYKKLDNMEAIVTPLIKDVSILKQWKHDQELIKTNTKEVMDQIEQDKRNKVKDGIATYQLKSWHLIVGILGIVSLIIYAYAASKGIKP